MSEAIKLNNNVYLDSSGIVHNKTKLSDVLTYSTNEIKVGNWIDGKPIYRKVINIGTLPNSTRKEIATNISNLKLVTKIYGVATTGAYTITVPDTYPNGAVYDTRLSYDNSTGKIILLSASDRSAYSGYVIMEYTKTTD